MATYKHQGDLLVKNNLTVDNNLNLSSETVSRVLQLDGSGNIESSSVTNTELGYLSGVTSSIQTQLGTKLDDFTSSNDNRLVRTDGTSGNAIQDSGITVDDSNNMSGVNDLTISGDLTVNGTTTSINTTNLNVEDKNITVNDGGNDASSEGAGLTIQRTGTDGSFVYEDALASKFKAGALGSEIELANVSSTQTLTNKTIVVANNTITTAASGNLTSTELNAALAELQSDIDTRQPDVITTEGDLVIGDASGDPVRLPIGTAGQVLQSNGDTASWETIAVNDELVKISSNDTTAGYLEDKIVVSSGANTTNILEVSTLNDGANEDLQIQIDESKIDHDALLNFVADEHVDHSTVDITAGIGLTGGGDITATRTIDLDVPGLTAETTNDDADLIVIYDDSASAHRKMTRANFLSGMPVASVGDINETSFALANNQVVAANVTGFAFANADVRGFKAFATVEIDATADLFESFELIGIQKGSSWDMSVASVGDDSGVVFSITTAGQIQYVSSNAAGFVSGSIKFRALTTSI